SSRQLNGATPRVVGCFGNSLKLGVHQGLTEYLVSKYPPIHFRYASPSAPLLTSTPKCRAMNPAPRATAAAICGSFAALPPWLSPTTTTSAVDRSLGQFLLEWMTAWTFGYAAWRRRARI